VVAGDHPHFKTTSPDDGWRLNNINLTALGFKPHVSLQVENQITQWLAILMSDHRD